MDSGAVPLQADLLQSVIDTAGCVIIGLRTDRTIFEWNAAAEALYLTTRAEALGKDYVYTFLAPEFHVPVSADIEKVLAGTPTKNFEDDSVLPDGRRRTLIWNVSRVLAPDGSPYGVVAVGQDITERKQAEEKFRLVFEHTNQPIVLSEQGLVLDCNPAALALLGMTDKAQLIGHHPAEFSPETQPDGQASAVKSRHNDQVTYAQGAQRFEWMHRRLDGTTVPVEVKVRRAVLGDRMISLVAWHDLSERLQLTQQQDDLQRRLALSQRMEAVGQLAGGVAHDFNNLLTAMQGAVHLAQLEIPDDHPASAELAIALQAADRAAALTRQLLTFSRRDTLAADVLDMHFILRESEGLVRRVLRDDCLLELHLADGTAPVLADRSQMEQVLLNLAINARDAMPDGGRLSITTRFDRARGWFFLSVRDSGIGMDAATLSRVFEPFFTTKPVGRGTGLGLAVVYGIIAQCGGTVYATSEVGRGTEFVVELPLAEATRVSDAPPVAGALPRGVETLLLVEDEPHVRNTTKRLLERFGYTVLEAEHGAQALEIWGAHRAEVRLVVSDVRMPVMGGLELAKQLRRAAPEVPILLMSGYDGAEQDGAVVAVNAPLLTKPFSSSLLLTSVRDMLDGTLTGA